MYPALTGGALGQRQRVRTCCRVNSRSRGEKSEANPTPFDLPKASSTSSGSSFVYSSDRTWGSNDCATRVLGESTAALPSFRFAKTVVDVSVVVLCFHLIASMSDTMLRGISTPCNAGVVTQPSRPRAAPQVSALLRSDCRAVCRRR